MLMKTELIQNLGSFKKCYINFYISLLIKAKKFRNYESALANFPVKISSCLAEYSKACRLLSVSIIFYVSMFPTTLRSSSVWRADRNIISIYMEAIALILVTIETMKRAAYLNIFENFMTRGGNSPREEKIYFF